MLIDSKLVEIKFSSDSILFASYIFFQIVFPNIKTSISTTMVFILCCMREIFFTGEWAQRYIVIIFRSIIPILIIRSIAIIIRLIFNITLFITPIIISIIFLQCCIFIPFW
ncbi:hypothetical protein PanWU01x14_032420 [Parasponia andersonii]|uniref:Transmembrane protein n=1 Tax=Parasponia andersonii TaxID=3476 RepID=A0A2P5DUE3_PARAD|nr:hypothetical protein PanWU01x14_032420 [Parasponia andersonii]